MHRFEIFAFEKYHDLETLVRWHSGLLEMTPLDSSRMISYSHFIFTLALASTVLRFSVIYVICVHNELHVKT